MPGAWERSPSQSVLVAILTKEIVTTAWAMGLRKIVLPNGSGITAIAGMPFDHARNSACQWSLERGFSHLFFLDDDVVPPPDVIQRLLAHNLPIVCGLYFRRHVGIEPLMLKDAPGGSVTYLTQFGWPQMIDVDYTGGGCMLIARRVLETMRDRIGGQRPWFEWKVDSGGKSEDYVFCQRARSLGFKVAVDTSIQCRHIGLGEARLKLNEKGDKGEPEFAPSEIIS